MERGSCPLSSLRKRNSTKINALRNGICRTKLFARKLLKKGKVCQGGARSERRLNSSLHKIWVSYRRNFRSSLTKRNAHRFLTGAKKARSRQQHRFRCKIAYNRRRPLLVTPRPKHFCFQLCSSFEFVPMWNPMWMA